MDTKNSQRIVHGSGWRDLDRVSSRGMVQRVTLVLLAVVALVATIAMPISAEEESDPWSVVPNVTGKDWFKTTYHYLNGYESYPDMLYALEIGIGFKPDLNEVVETLDAVNQYWNDFDYYETFYLGSGYFAYYADQGRGNSNPQSGYNADLFLIIETTTAKDSDGFTIPDGDVFVSVELRAVKQVRDNDYDIGINWTYTYYGGGTMELRSAQVRRYFTNTENYDFAISTYSYPVGFYFSFDLESTARYGMTTEYLNQYIPLITLPRMDAQHQIFFPNEYNVGYHVGFANGMETSYNNGYNAGYEQGRLEGELLWQQDQNALIKFLVAVFTAPSYIINTLFDFDLFGFNVATIIRVLLTLVIVAVITKFALKSFGG